MTNQVTTNPRTFAEAEAMLARDLPGYAARPPQQRGAQAVEECFSTSQHLLVQAGTGVGKSLMLLIPAILSGKRTVFSTATKSLQSQLETKDLPYLAQHFAFTWAVLRGRSNYFCINHATSLDPDPEIDRMIAEAKEPGFGGLRDDFSFTIQDKIWNKVHSISDECRELRCRDLGGCFAHVARENAKHAQIVVCNHALLATDLDLRHSTDGDVTMLGDYEYVICDEAHGLEGYVKSALGAQFTEGGMIALTTEVKNFVERNALRSDAGPRQAVSAAREMLWMAFASMMKAGESKLRITKYAMTESDSEWTALSRALLSYSQYVNTLEVSDTKAARRLRILKARAARLSERFDKVIIDSFEETVRWLEVDNSGRESRIVVKVEPLDVAPFLSEALFTIPTILCSATLTVNRSFDFIARQLGVASYRSLDVGTMFDYANQALIYIPRDLPEPVGRTNQSYQTVAPQRMLELVRASQGRALLLFTSKSAMERAYNVIAPAVDWTCLRQNGESVPALTRKFKEDTHSILFATKSFFQGFDIPGEALSLVILDKLTFAMPKEPTEEAANEAIKRRGGDPFNDRSIPMMILDLEQACGRLIRSVTDTGCCAILDSRIYSKGYGKKVLRSLFAAPITNDLGDVENFYNK